MRREKKVAVLSDDAIFARMLTLELSARGYAVSDEKNAELLVVDLDTHKRPDTIRSAVCFGRDAVDSENFLRRPFEMEKLFAMLDSASVTNEMSELEMIGGGKISVAGEVISLSSSETALLELLLCERATPVSRERIAREIFPDAKDGTKVADVYICYLRKKIDDRLGRTYIKTVRGKGYMIK